MRPGRPVDVGIVVGLAVAGAIGAPARYLVDAFVSHRTRAAFPWGTLVVNVTGCFLLGIIAGAAMYHAFPDTATVWLGTGFCGAYTTFSTFTFETTALLRDSRPLAALLYVGASVLLGLAASAIGYVIGRAVM